jgi:hypothetical protein
MTGEDMRLRVAQVHARQSRVQGRVAQVLETVEARSRPARLTGVCSLLESSGKSLRLSSRQHVLWCLSYRTQTDFPLPLLPLAVRRQGAMHRTL